MLRGEDVGVLVVEAESTCYDDAVTIRICSRRYFTQGTYRSRVPNAATTTALGCQDIWRSLTRKTETRKRAKSVMMSIAPMASQRGNCEIGFVSQGQVDDVGFLLPGCCIAIAMDTLL